MNVAESSSDIPQVKPREKRFSRPLPRTGVNISIPRTWQELRAVPSHLHDEKYVAILEKSGIAVASPVPLVGRYSKPRRWSAEELSACVKAHFDGVPIALMSAALNRNPQDIIFRLLDECSDTEGGFRQVGLKPDGKWSEVSLSVGRELFEAGLTAWRIAAVFRVDFEGIEKALYKGRENYGHVKKNPFAICTDHKQVVNRAILSRASSVAHVLDAFAGEGRFSETVCELFPDARIQCVEEKYSTYDRGREKCKWPTSVTWTHGDNVPVMKNLATTGVKFDLIDLDPFISCREQIDLVWPLLSNEGLLFLTFGGEYRRSFIGSNRKAIHRRYGFADEAMSNKEYLEKLPSFFIGWVAKQAALHGYVFDIQYCVRYPNNCRFWMQVRKKSPTDCEIWLNANVLVDEPQFQWKDLLIPRFSEARDRVDELVAGIPYAPKMLSKQPTKIKQMAFEI